ncbi:MAG: putative Rmd1/YagE family protein, partial [Porticoccus sp.]
THELSTIHELLAILATEHHKHAAFLEWIIIVLIDIDIDIDIVVYLLPN